MCTPKFVVSSKCLFGAAETGLFYLTPLPGSFTMRGSLVYCLKAYYLKSYCVGSNPALQPIRGVIDHILNCYSLTDGINDIFPCGYMAV